MKKLSFGNGISTHFTCISSIQILYISPECVCVCHPSSYPYPCLVLPSKNHPNQPFSSWESKGYTPMPLSPSKQPVLLRDYMRTTCLSLRPAVSRRNSRGISPQESPNDCCAQSHPRLTVNSKTTAVIHQKIGSPSAVSTYLSRQVKR